MKLCSPCAKINNKNKLVASNHIQDFVYNKFNFDLALSKVKVIKQPWSLTLDNYHVIGQTEF